MKEIRKKLLREVQSHANTEYNKLISHYDEMVNSYAGKTLMEHRQLHINVTNPLMQNQMRMRQELMESSRTIDAAQNTSNVYNSTSKTVNRTEIREERGDNRLTVAASCII